MNLQESARMKRGRVIAGIAETICVLAAIVLFASCKQNVDPEPAVPVITITTQPADRAVTEGDIDSSDYLWVGVSVTPSAEFSYQWYSNTENSNSGGTAISGQTSATYIIPASLTPGTYYYYCVVSAPGADPVRSRAAVVTVNAPGGTITPVISIVARPTDHIVTESSISGYLSVTASVTKSATLSYQWYSNTSDSNSGGTAINGATNSYYYIPAGLVRGTYYYYCVISATGGAAPVRSEAAAVTVNAPGTITPVISIVAQPTDRVVTKGSISGYLSVTASVTKGATLSYQWYSNTSDSNSGGTAIPYKTISQYYIPEGLTAGTYYYYCVISATGGAAPVRSEAAAVTVNAPGTITPVISIVTQPIDCTVTEGSISGYLSVAASVTPSAALSYQWYSNTNDSNSGGTAVINATNSYYYIPEGLAAGTYYYYCVASAAGGAAPVRSEAAAVTVNALAEPEAKVVIQLGNMNDPSLIPQTATTYANSNRSFTVSGTGYTAYQWYVDGIPAGTSATYTFNRPKGTYELVAVVTGSDGRKYSGRCQVTVQ